MRMSVLACGKNYKHISILNNYQKIQIHTRKYYNSKYILLRKNSISSLCCLYSLYLFPRKKVMPKRKIINIDFEIEYLNLIKTFSLHK